MTYFSWQTWTIIGLAGLLIFTLESAYRLTNKYKEEFKTRLDNYKNELDQLRNQHKEETYMPLSEAVEKLKEEGRKQTHSGYSLDYIFKMQHLDAEFNRLARLLADHLDIYGKQASSSFGHWVKINDYVINGHFKKRATELYLKRYSNMGPDFIDLAIKKDDLERAIKEILSSDRPLYQG
jgi:Sec-independent protein translocase protein TatA